MSGDGSTNRHSQEYEQNGSFSGPPLAVFQTDVKASHSPETMNGSANPNDATRAILLNMLDSAHGQNLKYSPTRCNDNNAIRSGSSTTKPVLQQRPIQFSFVE